MGRQNVPCIASKRYSVKEYSRGTQRKNSPDFGVFVCVAVDFDEYLCLCWGRCQLVSRCVIWAFFKSMFIQMYRHWRN